MCHGNPGKSLRSKPGGVELGPIGDARDASLVSSFPSPVVAERLVLVAAGSRSTESTLNSSADPPRLKSESLVVEVVLILIF